MPNYDFNTLLDEKNFEYFSKDIIETREKLKFEIFGEGKDNGIDLRNISKNGTTIVQVKRHSDFNTLYSVFKNQELDKVKKNNPDRYIITTSLKMTVARKQKIMELFKGYIKTEGDILGKEDLNSLLGKPEYKWIEEKYYQLWINSTNILKNIIQKEINCDIYIQSKDEFEKIQETSNIYVKNENFEKAINKIEKNKCLLICGEPEVGKTTLARNLSAYLLNKNREAEFIKVSSISDVLKVYKEEKSQIFFIDDFWGSKFDGNLKWNNETKLKQTIEIIEKSSNKVLILTSREYILSQGYSEYPELEEFFDKFKLNLNIKDYSDLFKARILFKHLENSQLSWNAVYQIAEGYRWIINNNNYSPRIIENYIDYVSDKEITPIDYLEDFIEYLNHPHKIWKEVFEKQCEGAQLITILMLLFNEPIKLEDIKKLFNACLDYNIKIDARKKDFMKYITQLENTIITTYQDFEYSALDVFVKFKNSSVELYIYKHFNEYLLDEYAETIIKATNCLNNLMYLSGSWKIIEHRYNARYEDINYDLSLNRELQELIINKIIKDFDKLYFRDEGEYFSGYKEEGNEVPDKLLKIIQIYVDTRSFELLEFIKEKIKNLITDLGVNKYVNYQDMFAIPHLIHRSMELNIYTDFNKKEIIENFYKAIRFSAQIPILEKFEEIFPEEYKEFISNVNIKEKIINLTLDDASFFMSDALYDALDELKDITIPDLFKEYNIKYEKWYLDEFYNITEEVLYADKKRLRKVKDKMDYIFEDAEEEILEIEEKQKQKEEKIIEREKKRLIDNYNNYLSEHEIKNYINDNVKNKQLAKKIYSIYEENNKVHIRDFFDDEESFELLIDYVINQNKIEENSKDFFEGLINYILEKNKKLNNHIIEKLSKIAYQTFKWGRDAIFERELEEVFNQEIINELINSKMMYRIRKKYYFQTIYLHIYLAVCELIKNKDDWEEIYRTWLQERTANNFKYILEDICVIYSDIDVSNFNLEFLLPQLKNFIEIVYDNEKEKIIKNIVEFFKIQIGIIIEEDIEVVSSTINSSTILIALEYIGMDLHEVITNTKKDDKIIEKLNKYYSKNQHEEYEFDFVNDIKDPNKYEILKKLGAIEYLNNLYNYSKDLIKKIENNCINTDFKQSLN